MFVKNIWLIKPISSNVSWFICCLANLSTSDNVALKSPTLTVWGFICGLSCLSVSFMNVVQLCFIDRCSELKCPLGGFCFWLVFSVIPDHFWFALVWNIFHQILNYLHWLEFIHLEYILHYFNLTWCLYLMFKCVSWTVQDGSWFYILPVSLCLFVGELRIAVFMVINETCLLICIIFLWWHVFFHLFFIFCSVIIFPFVFQVWLTF